jgi:hypothetical protein
VPSVEVPGRADLTDAQWARLAPLLPKAMKAGRPTEVYEVYETADHRWNPMANPCRRALAGRPGPIWTLTDRLWLVPPLAT